MRTHSTHYCVFIASAFLLSYTPVWSEDSLSRKPIEDALELASQGNYIQSIAAFDAVRKQTPHLIEPLDGDNMGTVYAAAGDKAGHEAFCEWLFEQFPLPQRVEDAERTAKTYIIFPGADNIEMLVHAEKLTRYAAENGAGGFLPWFHVAEGIALFRLKDYDEAGKWLAMTAENRDPNVRGLALAYSALNNLGQGKKRAARKLLKEAKKDLAKLPQPGSDKYRHQWPNVLNIELAINEVEAILEK
jgi:tetratricopeptide (TPR) repeat protein